MRQIEDINGVYTFVNPYYDMPCFYGGESTRCKCRYNVPVKAAKAKKKTKSKRRMVKQSRKHNR